MNSTAKTLNASRQVPLEDRIYGALEVFCFKSVDVVADDLGLKADRVEKYLKQLYAAGRIDRADFFATQVYRRGSLL